ncbi:MAG: NADP-dependent oxidoreductase [Pseudomonadota bacterium]
MTTTTNRQITLAKRPVGLPTDDDLKLVEGPLPEPGEGEALVRTIYLSLDPYMRGMMDDAESYEAPIGLGEVIVGGTVGEVVESKSSAVAVGEVVEAYSGWQDYAVFPGNHLRKLDPTLAPLTTALGVLGMPGLTAYHGLLEVGQPKAGETVFVSAASGAVGATVGQIAKIKGCRVAGCAGSDAKVAYCLDDCGYDACFNYKACGDIADAMRAACPDGIDVYFENVGGVIGRTAFDQLNLHGRVAVCGTISGYNATAPEMVPDELWKFIVKRARMEGLLVTDFADKHAAALAEMAGWIKDGRLTYRETIVDGLENAPSAFNGLFSGDNFGKLIIRVSDEPA